MAKEIKVFHKIGGDETRMDSRFIARALAEESIVLMKNDDMLLPLKEGSKVAVFGRAQEDTVFSGNGSGAVHTDSGWSILTACEKAGLAAEPELAEYYRSQVAAGVGCQEPFDWSQAGNCVNSGLMYEIFGQYRAPAEEYILSQDQLEKARKHSDTAILVLGRNSGGEECDRHLHEDYCLTASEKQLIADVSGKFSKIILVLNVNGIVDLSWIQDIPQIKSCLFIGIPGEQGAPALADILVGRVNPSGRLAFTVANRFEDYPAAKHFTWDKENAAEILNYASYGLDAKENGSIGFAVSPVTVYQEDIYVGYRYFDTFHKTPLFSFGEGLSYTTFRQKTTNAAYDRNGITLTCDVQNTGNYAGKDVILVYASARTQDEWPVKKLVGFEKTRSLMPQESDTVTVSIPWKELASYRESMAGYILGQGEYILVTGDSSDCLEETVHICIPEDIVIKQCSNRLTIQAVNKGKLDFLTAPERKEEQWNAPWEITLTEAAVSGKIEKNPKLFDCTETLSNEELASLCVGYGPGVPFSAFLKEEFPNTLLRNDGSEITCNDHPAGFHGYVSPAMPDKGIHSVFYKDGPAGIGETAWPAQMVMACAFNKELWYEFGACIAGECEKQQVDIWLAPAVNLHRNPLGGRNFEYFSEDPFLTGKAAASVAKGVQENGSVLVCPKHFAANEQETFRRGSRKRNADAVDSILTERALRELYLKPFQMMIEEAGIHCIMTSFNKINGTFAGGSRDLCTGILREEWGFDGAVITDWGDMDTVVDGADAVAAGNDVIMPGGPPVIRQILNGLGDGRVTRDDMIKAVKHLLTMASYTKRG